MKLSKIKNDFYWCGLVDKDLEVFDIVMLTEYGSSYNSYILKTSDGLILFENVKMYKGKNKNPSFDIYLEHLNSVCKDLKEIKYIVINHTEPDHSGSIKDLIPFCNRNVKVICSYVAADYLKEIFNQSLPIIKVKDGDVINVGNKTLEFFDIPMLHWPDSMFTLIQEDKIVVSCDTLGAHYGYDELLISRMSEKEYKNTYIPSFIHYFETIMSPFKPYVLMAMAKMRKLFDEGKIEMIATGHGPIWDQKNRIGWAINKYIELSTIKNPYKKPLLLFVTCSAYEYTQEISDIMKKQINVKYPNEFEIKEYRIDIQNYSKIKTDILNDISFATGLLVGSPTLNNDSLPLVWDFLASVKPLESANKFACCFGSYGWSGEAGKNIAQRLKQLKFKTVKSLSIKFRCSEFDVTKINEYIDNFVEYVKTKRASDPDFIYRNASWNEAIWK